MAAPMPNVPESELAQIVADLESEGYTVTVERQADGRFTVIAEIGPAAPTVMKAPAEVAAAPATPVRSRPLTFSGAATLLGPADIARAADELACDQAAVAAVAEVESRGSGFLPDGRPTILFEAHVFSRNTDHIFDASHPEISSRTWNKALYGAGGAHQHDRLNAAIALNRNAALEAASWGMFQIMGFNAAKCGFSTITSFVKAMCDSEGRHLDAFVAFVKRRKLDDELRQHKWAAFAEGYNGAGFKENAYDTKLAEAWRRHATETGTRWLTLRQVQAALNRLGADPKLVVDGDIGAKTRRAIRDFQKATGLVEDGMITPTLIEVLMNAARGA